jgi:murein DD-endopeptidase MepM/ murein hydrolase activator NlpD
VTVGNRPRGLFAWIVAAGLAAALYASGRWPGRPALRVRQAVAALVLPGQTPAANRLAALERRLERFVAARAWGAVLDFWLPLYRAVSGPAHWVFPVPGGAIVGGYGWEKVGGRTRWSSGITVGGTPGAPVLAVIGGRVTPTARGVLLAGSGLTVVYGGVRPAGDPARVAAGAVVGHLRRRFVRLSVLEDGIPVDPLRPGWLKAPSRR